MNQQAAIISMPSTLAQSGVESSTFNSDTLTIRELTGRSIARLHCLPGTENLQLPAVKLPQKVGECIGTRPAVLCLRPQEWLCMDDSSGFSEQLLKSVKKNGNAFWTDLSDGLAVFRIEGAGAPWLLNKLSCLDYQSCHQASEHCARTRMGQVAVVVHFHRTPDDSEVFDLILDRSIARYLWELLGASAPHADDLVRASSLSDLT